MKYFNYILSISFLVLVSCGSNQENKQVQSRQKYPDTVIRQRFEKKILHKDSLESLEELPYTQKDLDELAYQKIQQYFEMLNLIKRGNQQESFKKYTEKYAKKLWLNPKKETNFSQKNDLKTADSLKLQELVLSNFKEIKSNELLGTYHLTYKTFKNNHSNEHQTSAKIFFDIIDLSMNGKIYQTIKAKIKSID